MMVITAVISVSNVNGFMHAYRSVYTDVYVCIYRIRR
jgi:hypothetical protein